MLVGLSKEDQSGNIQMIKKQIRKKETPLNEKQQQQ